MYNQQNMNGMCNQQNINGMYNNPNNMYGMGGGHHMCNCNCNCNCGCYNPYPPYPPYPPCPPWPPEPENNECFKCCDAFREFSVYLFQVAEALNTQSLVGMDVYNSLQEIINKLETNLKNSIEQQPLAEQQVQETKRRYNDCIIECENNNGEPCGCGNSCGGGHGCDCYCEPCYNEVEGYCPQCDALREEYDQAVLNFDMLAAAIVEHEAQIAGLKGYAEGIKVRAELQAVEAESFYTDSKGYEKRYEDCINACSMDSGCGCM